MKITSIKAEKILDSRGDWTSKAIVELEDGSFGSGEVPSGASLGGKEATLVPVESAIDHINNIIARSIIGKDAYDQQSIDQEIIRIDNSENKTHLGANATLAVSLGVCEAAAKSSHLPLYQYISNSFNFKAGRFPTPLFNIINGGAHADNKLDFQEIMVAPATSLPFKQALDLGVSIYHQLKKTLAADNLSTGVGDEGGFAPSSLTGYKACDYIISSGKGAGFIPGKDFFIGIDVAANSFFSSGEYSLNENHHIKTADSLLDYYTDLSRLYPIIYLEDPFSENSLDDWQKAVLALSKNLDIIGDDLTVTNLRYLDIAINKKAVTGVIVKPNQIGTLSETVDFIKRSQENNLVITVSHRSGETGEDTFIADLAVAIGANYIKAGAPARGERVVKYNRLLEIYSELNNEKKEVKISN